MTWDSRNSMSERQLGIFQKFLFLLEGTRAFGQKCGNIGKRGKIGNY